MPSRRPARVRTSVAGGALVDERIRLGELVAGMRSALAELAAELETLRDEDVDAKTENVKYGPEPLSAFFDRYVIAHKAGHLDQLRALAAEP